MTTGDRVTVHSSASTETYCERGGNEIAVDSHGHVYINGADFDFVGGGAPQPGWITLVAPDGTYREVASDIEFPNGMVITADTAAHTGKPEAPGGACVRVLEGGEITHRVETDLPCFSCALGGDGGRQLLLLCNEFEGVDQMVAIQERRSARVLITEAPVRRAEP